MDNRKGERRGGSEVRNQEAVSLLFRSTVAGLVLRLALLCCSMLLVLLVFVGLRQAEVLPVAIGMREILLVFGLVSVTTVLGQVLSEYPFGDPDPMSQMNVVIFVRSGLLLAIIVGWMLVSGSRLGVPVAAMLMTFYSVGLFLGIYLDACRLNRLV